MDEHETTNGNQSGHFAPRDEAKRLNRRSFLSVISSTVMAFGLSVGYGLFAWLMGRFLYPSRPARKVWHFITDLGDLSTGQSLMYDSPAGQRIVVTRLDENGTADDFIALSSVCPHLGCRVHWEAQNERFFCPCHNGAFDASGKATAGPPKDAGQMLSRYPLQVENGLLFIEVPTESLT